MQKFGYSPRFAAIYIPRQSAKAVFLFICRAVNFLPNEAKILRYNVSGFNAGRQAAALYKGEKMTELFKTVLNLIDAIHLALYELYERENRPVNDFCRGQTYAYVECLEILQRCPELRSSILNYDIEKRYPLT